MYISALRRNSPWVNAFWNAVSLESQSQRASRSVELLPIRQESVTGGFSSTCKKPVAGGAVEEDTALWHLMKRLGLDEAGCNSGFPAFQTSGGGIEALA